jgi:DNA-binding transcriptional regulator YdaS (Cro superfamily)
MNLRTYLDALPPGGKTAFAKRLGIAGTYLYQLTVGIRDIPPTRAIEIAAATGWRVTPHELRPDLYPNPDDGLPPEVRERAA